MIGKEEVYRLLLDHRFETLLDLFDRERNTVRRYLTMATCRDDGVLRWRAIEFFGYLAEARAGADPGYFREIIRRHIWGMNEEGANVDWSAPEIIGSIIASQPALYGEFATVMICAAIDEPIFQKGMLWAAGEIAARDRSLLDYYLPRLKEFTISADPETAALAGRIFTADQAGPQSQEQLQ